MRKFLSLGGAHKGTQSRTLVGLSFVLLAFLACALFLTSLTAKHQGVHAAKPADNGSGSGAVSKTWYFAEGRVGGGFREYLTIGNPNPTIDCPATITYEPQGEISDAQAKQHLAARKPLDVKTITVTHASRYTASVNQDLGVSEQQQPGMLLSAVVSIPNTSACAGVVVERPMYFSYHGVTSGSDALGTTTLSQTYYLADVPTQAGTSSFVNSYISVLNPSQTTNAQVQLQYYTNAQTVGNQTLYIAPGASATIYPGSQPYPHISVTLQSNIAVAVERSTYTYHMQEGNAGIVSSASTVVAAQTWTNHWLFAEGYTGGQYQENLVLSNPTQTDTIATVTLEYQNGHNQVVTVPVNGLSQVIENINTLNSNPTGTCDVTPCQTTPEVSADVTASRAGLVVERQMFFHYTHTLPNTSVNVTTTGGSDVTGAVSTATSTANFAEGYTNAGYNEWITLQNPTSSTEILALTLVNEYGRTYTENETLTPKSRSTVDITQRVRDHLVQSGDDFRAYQVSASVQATASGQSFVAERPMYFATKQGNMGGTDVIGFTGITSTLPVNTVTNFTELPQGHDPFRIAKGVDGNLWFTEYYGNNIGVMTPTGILIAEYPIPTMTSLSEGITAGPDGNMWFVETSNGGKIASITPTGVITEYTAGLSANSGPRRIVAGPDGNVWFTEPNVNKIGKITPSGTITEYPASGTPFGITLGGDKNLWFTETIGNKIGKITTTGTITEYSNGISSSSYPGEITAGPDGNIWFTQGRVNQIGKIAMDGTITEYSNGITSGGSPDDITAGPDGNVWFTEGGVSQIGKITPSGTVTEYSNSISYPNGITAGSDGNIWFTEPGSGALGRIVVG